MNRFIMILQNSVVFDPCFATARGSAHEAFQIAKNPTFNSRTPAFVRNNAEKIPQVSLFQTKTKKGSNDDNNRPQVKARKTTIITQSTLILNRNHSINHNSH